MLITQENFVRLTRVMQQKIIIPFGVWISLVNFNLLLVINRKNLNSTCTYYTSNMNRGAPPYLFFIMRFLYFSIFSFVAVVANAHQETRDRRTGNTTGITVPCNRYKPED